MLYALSPLEYEELFTKQKVVQLCNEFGGGVQPGNILWYIFID